MTVTHQLRRNSPHWLCNYSTGPPVTMNFHDEWDNLAARAEAVVARAGRAGLDVGGRRSMRGGLGFDTCLCRCPTQARRRSVPVRRQSGYLVRTSSRRFAPVLLARTNATPLGRSGFSFRLGDARSGVGRSWPRGRQTSGDGLPAQSMRRAQIDAIARDRTNPSSASGCVGDTYANEGAWPDSWRSSLSSPQSLIVPLG